MPLASEDGERQQLRVLVVEDEMMVALLVREMLADFGYRVVGPIAQLDRAVETARKEAIDVALLDVNINGREVYPVATTLTDRGIPFVFVTGYGQAGLRPEFRACPTLQKPYRPEDLRDIIARVLVASGRG